jgi:menaquinone-dependent protoporphyrinogen oxidase
MLVDKLQGEVELHNLKKTRDIDLSRYNKIVIGGSIYIGKIQKEVTEFSSSNLNALKEKKIGLFICGMQEEEVVEKELKDSFPDELYSSAVAKEVFGGEFIFKKMNFFERLIIKKVSKIDKDVSTVSEEKITRFAEVMNKA